MQQDVSVEMEVQEIVEDLKSSVVDCPTQPNVSCAPLFFPHFHLGFTLLPNRQHLTNGVHGIVQGTIVMDGQVPIAEADSTLVNVS